LNKQGYIRRLQTTIIEQRLQHTPVVALPRQVGKPTWQTDYQDI